MVPVISGQVVADAVVHPDNLAPENQNPKAKAQLDAVYAAHPMATGPHPEHVLTEAESFTGFPVLHALPNLGFANSYLTAPERADASRDSHPGRFALYATVDTRPVDDAIKALELHFGAMQRFITDARLKVDGIDEVDVRASTTVLWSPGLGPAEAARRPREGQ